MVDRTEFRYEMSDWVDCLYCSGDVKLAEGGKELPSNLNSFLELQAAYNLWDVMAPPMLNYMSQEIRMSCGLVRYFLKSFVSIADPGHARQIQTLLELHASLHPPCRPGMDKFYLSALFEPINNQNFNYTENFFDFVSRIHSSKTSEEKRESKPVIVNTHTDAVVYLEQSLKQVESPSKTLNPSETLDSQMFIFNYCINILEHDFLVRSRHSDRRSLVFDVIWRRFEDGIENNFHVAEVFRMFKSISPKYRRDLGKYLVLLAEVVRLHDDSAEKEFPYFGAKCHEFVSWLAKELRKSGSVTARTVDAVRDIPSNWLKYQLSVCMLTHQLCSYSEDDGNHKKKLFAVFKKSSKCHERL